MIQSAQFKICTRRNARGGRPLPFCPQVAISSGQKSSLDSNEQMQFHQSHLQHTHQLNYNW